MTTDDLHAKRRELTTRMGAVNTKIVEQSRHLIAVLKDAGRPNSAKPLEELFFERDAIAQELEQLLKVNLNEILRIIVEEAGRKP